MNGLTRILGGEMLFKPTSLLSDEVQAAVKELAKEEKEKFVKEFKEKAVALIQKKRDHDKHVAKLFAEAKQKEEQNMTGFIEDAKKLFSMVKDIQNIEKDYYTIFMGAAEGKSVVADTSNASPAAQS